MLPFRLADRDQRERTAESAVRRRARVSLPNSGLERMAAQGKEPPAEGGCSQVHRSSPSRFQRCNAQLAFDPIPHRQPAASAERS